VSAASISGTVFNDLNGNGAINPGEPGVPGVTVNLDTNADGSVDASTVTSASGTYTFGSLAAGTYRVRETAPAGTVQTSANPADLVLGAATDVTGVDFGNFTLITISGLAFNDLNGDGVQGPGEPGMSGVTIQLDTGANGSVDATTVTGASGTYAFTGLGPGTYRVREVVPAGFAQTSANPADVTPASGVDVSGINFGDQAVAAPPVPALDEKSLVALAVALAVIAAAALRR